jgi:hypothetical protein
MLPGPPTPVRGGWDSTAISSPSITCTHWPTWHWSGRDLDTAEHLTEQVRYLTERRRPLFEFLALLDRAQIWAARRQLR